MSLIYIYFGYAGQNTDPASSVTISSSVTGHIWIGRPVRVVTPQIGDTSRTEPDVVFTKEEGEQIDIWFDIRPLLAAYIDPNNGRLTYEEIKRVQPKSLDASGTDSDARYAQDDMYFIKYKLLKFNVFIQMADKDESELWKSFFDLTGIEYNLDYTEEYKVN